jgi:hypothetical protein
MSRRVNVNRSTFTDTEWRLYKRGRCCWQTAYGMPWIRYCGRKLDRGNPWGYCKRYAREAIEDYGARL